MWNTFQTLICDPSCNWEASRNYFRNSPVPATVHLIIGSLPLKNGLIQHQSKMFMSMFLFIHSNRLIKARGIFSSIWPLISSVFHWEDLSNSEYLVRNQDWAALLSYSIQKRNKYCEYFGLAEPRTPRLLGTGFKYVFKVRSWLTYGWKTVIFPWCFFTFHENSEGFMVQIRV